MTETSNSGVLVNRSSFRPITNSYQEKLREAWPIVKSLLEELGHSCSMDTVDSTVIMESPGSTDPHNIRKAKFLFELLCKTPVPAPLAIEMALHGRQHDVINLGTQNGGMCKKYGINKEEFDKFWRGLKSCLKELEDLTHCTLFLNKGTLIVVGPSPRVRWVRNVWKFSITGKLSPAHVIRVLNLKLKRTTMMGNSDSMMIERSDFGVLEQPKSDHLFSDPFLMREKNDFTVLEPPESNHEVNDPLPAENSKCFHVISAENRAMDEQMVSERVRQKLQDVNTAVQNYLSPVQDHVNFTLQQAYFKCAYECFDRRRSQQEIGNCVENCSVPVVSAQQRVENEMAKFQERLSRALMVCQDKFDAAKLQQAKTSALNDLESCVQQTTEDGIKMLPLLAERLKSSFSINN